MNSFEKEYISDSLIYCRFRTLERIRAKIIDNLENKNTSVSFKMRYRDIESTSDYKLTIIIDDREIGWLTYLRDNGGKFYITNVVM